MANILIVYASNSGSTFQVAEIIESVLGKKHHVVVQKAVQTLPEDLAKYDLVLLGSPSWLVENNEGMPLESMLNLTRNALNKKSVQRNFAVFGCGDNSYTYFCGAVDYLENFVKDIGGKLVTNSLKIDSFYFDLHGARLKVEEWGREVLKVLK